MQRPIWLIGMMGSGKTTVAPLVAAALGREWVDADVEIERHTGSTVAELFADSEERFRAAEVDAITALATGHAVVATGGGVVTTAAAAIMSDSGVVVWLRASIETLSGRLGEGSDRPLLTDSAAGLERIEAHRRQRYANLADVVVDTDDFAPSEVAELVVKALATVSVQA